MQLKDSKHPIKYPLFVPLFYYKYLIGTMIVNKDGSRIIKYTDQYTVNDKTKKYSLIGETPKRMKLSPFDETVLKLLPIGYDSSNLMTRPKMVAHLRSCMEYKDDAKLARKADASIERLFDIHHVPIATQRSNGGGRWIATNYQEIDDSLKATDRQAQTMLENNAKRRAFYYKLLHDGIKK